MERLALGLLVLISLAVSGIAQTTDWTQITTASSPSARRDHSMAYDSARGKVVLFGGEDSNPPWMSLNDTWEYDGVTWTQISPASSPGIRSGHKMVYDSVRGKVVLFGGCCDATGFPNDTWEYDGVDWTQAPPGWGPSGREGHAMVYDSVRGKVVMFGGYDGGFPNDTWEYGHTPNGVYWTQVTTASSPSARYLHAMAYDSARQKVVMFGGNVGVVNDTWEYDGVYWWQISTTSSPSTREAHAMAYDSVRGKVVMFGGYDGVTGLLHDTWEYDCTTCATSIAYGSGCPTAQPLALNSNPPVLGTNWLLTASSVDPASPFCLFWFGVTALNPGVDLSFIGATGCFAYTNANIGAFSAPVTSGSGTFTVSVPNNSALLAYALTVQASAASNSTAAGFVTSNGLTGVLGY